MNRFASLVVCTLLPATTALAQADSRALANLRACAGIESDTARLACFDAALVPTAPSASPARTVDTAPRAAERPSTGAATSAPNPGAPQPAAPARGTERGAPTDALVIVDVREIRNGMLFVADDGTQWLQTSGIRGGYPPVPFEAALRPGVLSGSLLEFADGSRRGRSIRVTPRE